MPTGVFVRTKKTRDKMSLSHIGIKHSDKSKFKMSLAKKGISPKCVLNGNNTGEKHPRWRGDKVGYVPMHLWVRRQKGDASKCSNPNCIYPRRDSRHRMMLEPKKYEWASISRKVLRDKNDYISLCASCHRKYDINKLTLEELFNYGSTETTKTDKKAKRIRE